MEIEKLEIAKLELKDGDILAVIVPDKAPEVEVVRLSALLAEFLNPLGVKALVFRGDIELSVISKTEDNPDVTLCH